MIAKKSGVKPKRLKLKPLWRRLLKEINNNPDILHTFSDEQLSDVVLVIKYELRKRCKKDLYFLCKYIVGYKDMVWYFHKPMCMLIQSINKYLKVKDDLSVKIPMKRIKRIWLWFRGSFKSSIITIGHTIQLILIDSNVRICIASNKLDNAKAFLLEIKDVFMFNPLFRFLFPEYCPQPNQAGKIEWGTKEAVTVPNRTTDFIGREATIECAGVDTGLVSRHYDYIKKDDLVTDKSVTTEEQIQATIDWDALSKSLFNIPERGMEDYVGTRYDYRDLYGIKMSLPDDQITKTVIPIMDSSGRPTFRPRFTRKGIKQLRRDQGPYIFACQNMLNPIPTEIQKFKPEWFDRIYTKLPEYFGVCILVDPANSRKRSAKYTAMIVHAVGMIENKLCWCLVDGVFDKLNPTQRVNTLFTLARRWHEYLRVVSYESIGFQETDVVYIKKKQEEEDFRFHITTVEAQEASKEGRIDGMIPFYENGKVLFPEHLYYRQQWTGRVVDLVEILKSELLYGKMCGHQDLADAQSQQLRYPRVAAVKKAVIKKPPPVGSFMWYREKMKKLKKSKLAQKYGEEVAWHFV